MCDNAIVFLQENCQQNCLLLPKYNDVCQFGEDHCKQFTVRCTVAQYSAVGTSNNKKSAKKLAAKNMVALLEDNDYFNKSKNTKTKTPAEKEIVVEKKNDFELDYGLKMTPDNMISYLQEYCQRLNIPLPVYVEVELKGDLGNGFTIKCQFQEYSVTCTDRNKKLAKKRAATKMFELLRDKHYFKDWNSKNFKVRGKTLKTSSGVVNDGHKKSNTEVVLPCNYVRILKDYCVNILQLQLPIIYEEVTGASKFLEVSCRFQNHITFGSGETTKIAKSAAAAAMLKILKEEQAQKSEVRFDEVIEEYKKLTARRKEVIPTNGNVMYLGEYSLLQGPAVTRIVNMDVDEIDEDCFTYIEDFTREQDIIMKIDHVDMIYESQMRSLNSKKPSDKDKGKFRSTISIAREDLPKLTFMGVGTTTTESFNQAVVMALTQLKIFLFSPSSEIENLNFVDSLQNIFPDSP